MMRKRTIHTRLKNIAFIPQTPDAIGDSISKVSKQAVESRDSRGESAKHMESNQRLDAT
jgi:hypothetical protein